MNDFAKCEKNFSVMMATAAITYNMISEYFHECEKGSVLVLDSMYLNLAEMPEKKVIQATRRAERALRDIPTGRMKDLNATVRIRRTKDNVRIVFSTMGFGDITADIDKWGDVKVAS